MKRTFSISSKRTSLPLLIVFYFFFKFIKISSFFNTHVSSLQVIHANHKTINIIISINDKEPKSYRLEYSHVYYDLFADFTVKSYDANELTIAEVSYQRNYAFFINQSTRRTHLRIAIIVVGHEIFVHKQAIKHLMYHFFYSTNDRITDRNGIHHVEYHTHSFVNQR